MLVQYIYEPNEYFKNIKKSKKKILLSNLMQLVIKIFKKIYISDIIFK